MNGIQDVSLVIALIGATVVAAMLVRAACRRAGVPALVGYMLLGLMLRVVDGQGALLTPGALHVLEILAGIGIVALLFRVGIEADAKAMLGQLRRAAAVWVVNVGLSGALGFATAHWLLGQALIPSLFVGVALTATSLGVCLGVWREAGRLDTPAGALLTDVAELDDISGILLMIALLAIAPVLYAGNGDLAAALGETGLIVAAKVAVFAGVCFGFAHYLERRLTGLFTRMEAVPDPMLPIAGMALMIAAIAGWLGFTLAVGALFAGLIFSRESVAPAVDRSFSPLYDVFAPFFFIHIGIAMDPQHALAGLALGAPLLVAAVVGKVAGTVLPALPMTSAMGGVILGVSMVPRAEIALVIAAEGRRLGDWAMPPELFSGLVFVALATSLLSPVAVTHMLKRWPPRLNGERAGGESAGGKVAGGKAE